MSVALTGINFLKLVATTGPAGFALVNGTPTILTWNVPNDGNMHRVQIFGSRNITVAETGGAVTFSVPLEGGFTLANVIAAGSGAVSNAGIAGPGQGYPVVAGGTVTVAQTSALTAGAATFYLELWGS